MANLDLFTQLETLILSGNYISEISAASFACNPKLRYLSLSKNKLTMVRHLSHLLELQALDLSGNLLETADLGEYPPNLLSLKLKDNPIEQAAAESGKLSLYRKPFVLHLKQLEQMDKIEVVAAERMSYEGTLPRRINIDEMLRLKIKNDNVRQQVLKMESEVRVEIKRD